MTRDECLRACKDAALVVLDDGGGGASVLLAFLREVSSCLPEESERMAVNATTEGMHVMGNKKKLREFIEGIE